MTTISGRVRKHAATEIAVVSPNHNAVQYSHLLLTLVLLSSASSPALSNEHKFLSRNVKTIKVQEFEINSKAGRDLLDAASLVDTNSSNVRNTPNSPLRRKLEDTNGFESLGNYAIKFQDCHSVTQWNNGNGTEVIMIMGKTAIEF